MTSSQKKKLIGTNAGVWVIATLASFILPFIVESVSSGSSNFLQVLCFAAPLVMGMVISTMDSFLILQPNYHDSKREMLATIAAPEHLSRCSDDSRRAWKWHLRIEFG